MTRRDDLLQRASAAEADAVRFLRDLLRIPSVTKHEAEVGAFIAERLRRSGAPVSVVEAEPGHPNVLLAAKGAAPGPTFLLNDHMDVVPAGPLDQWTVDPFGAEERDGWVYGRGAVDSKGGLAALLMATEAYLAAGGPHRGELLLTAVCDEEMGSVLGTRYLLARGLIRGDFGLVAEPTGNRIEVATKGVFHVEIATRGRIAHGGKPWAGVNAIEQMGRFMAALGPLRERLATRTHALLGHPSLMCSMIQGGTVPNMVPGECRMVVDRRIIPGETSAQALAEIEGILETLRRTEPTFQPTTRVLLDWPGVEVPADMPVVPALRQAIVDVLGREPEVGGKDGGTDAAWIYQATKIPMVHFSPGESLYVLGPDERIRIADYLAAIKVLVLTLHAILG